MLLKRNDTIIFYGDSVTDCGRNKENGEGVLWYDDDWGKGYVAFINAKFNLYYHDLHIRVINKGISGNTSGDLVKRLEKDVLSNQPQWVSICIGINDVWRHFDSNNPNRVSLNQFRDNMIYMIENIFVVTKNIILVTPYLVESKGQSPMRKMMDDYGNVVKELAKQYDLFFVDLQEAFDEKLWNRDSSTLSLDRIHPTMAGHMLIADSILEVLGVKGNEED